MKKLNKKLKIILIFVAVIIIALLVGYFMRLKPTGNSTSTLTINITTQNFASVLSKNSLFVDLPKDAVLRLNFGNISYALRKASVKEEAVENADIILSLPSKYMQGLTNKNLCSVIKKANNAGDLGFETTLSTASLAWKFKSMYKYKDCLGF